MIPFKRKLFHDVRTYQMIRLTSVGIFIFFIVLVVHDNRKDDGVSIIDEQEEILLPGQFNLLEEISQFNGAMRRPQKKCTLGKPFVDVFFIRYHVCDKHKMGN